jgi:hypothetical protein
MGKKQHISTVHLGQFSREVANDIAGHLEQAGIVWWYKAPGFFSQIWEMGVRLFVDKDRLEEAQEIARKVASGELPPPPPPGDPGDADRDET